MKEVFKRLSRVYTWTPQQISRLTLPQALAYMVDDDARAARTHGDVLEFDSVADAEAYRVRLAREMGIEDHAQL